jgi:hypothetical protein
MEAFIGGSFERHLNDAEDFNVSTKVRMDALEVQLTNMGSFQAR